MTEITTPVALFLYNRPDLTQQVLAAVRAVRPAQLFLVADGPYPDAPNDAQLCAAARQVVEVIDWPCRVVHHFAPTNMGCGYRVASGLDWLFDQVEEAIILEDDTLPDPSFFVYCQALLARYRNESSVMGIGGHNGLGVWRPADGSYFFHRQPAIWGWATWRRAWRANDISLERYRAWDVETRLFANIADREQARFWLQLFERCLGKPPSTWDIQWSLICALLGGIWISPAVNLVTNIGFDARATHTTLDDDLRQYITAQAMTFPLVDPTGEPGSVIDDHFDRWNYLLQTLNSYRDVRILQVWRRALERNPELVMPGIFAGGRSTLAPLRQPAELLEVLDYVAPYLHESPRFPSLHAALTVMVTNG